ncbi:MAG: hypothetical protein NUW12_05735 [Firmicutes bacterium]|jgi:hypothetical protein|nr:hypothetical protein [Bacillota bacterium]MDH7495525.1 hypothetical protein [Bacillota bacterium]
MTIVVHKEALWIAGKPSEILRALAILCKGHVTLAELLSSPRGS